jgi:DNA-binding transcriptional MerR regulator
MYDQRRELTVKMEFVKELMAKYRDARTLTNVLDNLGAEMNELEASIAKHEKEADKRMRESQAQAFRDFEEAINNEANHGKEGF